MMIDHYDIGGIMRMRDVMTVSEPNIRTGVGYGHPRKFNREKPPKGAYAKKHKRSKMSKESRKRNRSRT